MHSKLINRIAGINFLLLLLAMAFFCNPESENSFHYFLPVLILAAINLVLGVISLLMARSTVAKSFLLSALLVLVIGSSSCVIIKPRKKKKKKPASQTEQPVKQPVQMP